jgi:anti-anti-sigma factor
MTLSSFRTWFGTWFAASRVAPERETFGPQVEEQAAGLTPPRVAQTRATTVSTPETPSPQLGSREALDVRITEQEQGVVVCVSGRAGSDNLHALEFTLIRLSARRVPLAVLDLSDLTLLSSLAMGMLVGLRRDLGRWQSQVKLACVPVQIHEALDKARLTTLFEIHATVEEALKATTALASSSAC